MAISECESNRRYQKILKFGFDPQCGYHKKENRMSNGIDARLLTYREMPTFVDACHKNNVEIYNIIPWKYKLTWTGFIVAEYYVFVEYEIGEYIGRSNFATIRSFEKEKM